MHTKSTLGDPWVLDQLRRDLFTVPDQNDLDLGVQLLEGADRARHFSCRRKIGAHRVQCDAHLGFGG